jgi:hypothetical protein
MMAMNPSVYQPDAPAAETVARMTMFNTVRADETASRLVTPDLRRP